MPALIKTEYTAEVTFIGSVTSMDRTELMAHGVDRVELGFDGLAGSVHAGENRASCSRVTTQYPKGTLIRNVRQLSIVSEEELTEIGARMGIERPDPARMGATLVIRGIPDFTHVPPSSRLQNEAGATVTIDMENQPCHFPSKSLEKADPGKGMAFKTAAKDRRGVTAWVERPGLVQVGDVLTLHIPGQRAWRP
ncbi:MAG: MOSC domain-containing protein [Pseudomonadota bacterium]